MVSSWVGSLISLRIARLLIARLLFPSSAGRPSGRRVLFSSLCRICETRFPVSRDHPEIFLRKNPTRITGLATVASLCASSRFAHPDRVAHVICQALPQEKPRPVHARLDRGQGHLEDLGDLGIRQPFDIAKEKGRPQTRRQLVDGATKHRPELTLDRGVPHFPRPGHPHLRMLALVIERGSDVPPRHLLALAPPPPPFLVC